MASEPRIAIPQAMIFTDVVLIAFEEFEAIAKRLRGEILKGKVMPKSGDEISRLIYHGLVGGESQS